MHFNQLHSVIKIEVEQLTEHYVVLCRGKQANQFLDVRASGAQVLGSQIVLLFTDHRRLDGHYIRN